MTDSPTARRTFSRHSPLVSTSKPTRRPGRARARSQCRILVLPQIHFIPDSRRESVPLFLKQQCHQTLGRTRSVAPAPTPRAPASATPRAPSEPARGIYATLAVSTVKLVCMALLYGCAGRLTSQNGGLRPGQVATVDAGDCLYMPAYWYHHTVSIGFGCIVALHYCSFALNQIY
jgi:hypothetical protein